MPQAQGSGHADVRWYFQCPLTQQMGFPANDDGSERPQPPPGQPSGNESQGDGSRHGGKTDFPEGASGGSMGRRKRCRAAFSACFFRHRIGRSRLQCPPFHHLTYLLPQPGSRDVSEYPRSSTEFKRTVGACPSLFGCKTAVQPYSQHHTIRVQYNSL